MVAKLCAVWLVLLIVLPFTAPFTTCGASENAPAHAKPHAPTVAHAPALEAGDDVIVTTERTLAIRRPGLVTAILSSCDDTAVQLIPRGAASTVTSLALHDQSSAILRI